MVYTISYNKGKFKQLDSKYKLLYCLHKENDTDRATLYKEYLQELETMLNTANN